MKESRVSELKAHLSSYLSAVREGETVIVYDRKTPIARIVPWHDGQEELGIEESAQSVPRLSDLPTVRLQRKVDVLAILREGRDQR